MHLRYSVYVKRYVNYSTSVIREKVFNEGDQVELYTLLTKSRKIVLVLCGDYSETSSKT